MFPGGSCRVKTRRVGQMFHVEQPAREPVSHKILRDRPKHAKITVRAGTDDRRASAAIGATS
jgi:hypothetical protein